MPDLSTFLATQTNRALRTAADVESARDIAFARLWPLHPTKYKAWDNALATGHALAAAPGLILDAGAETDSPFLRALQIEGRCELLGLNTGFARHEFRDGIEYRRADICATGLPDASVAFIGCLSVIEHMPDVRPFLAEAARVLRPGGRLFISTDYWPTPVDCGDRVAFGQPVRIMEPEDMRDLVHEAALLGLRAEGDIDLTAADPVVQWDGMSYTFANLLLARA